MLDKNKILENVTKCNCISRKFLKEQNITEKECYDIVYGSSKCNYCNNESKFQNWANGYSTKCSSNKCSKIQRAERTKKTNLQKYGSENVSDNKDIQRKKLETFKKNYGVENISQLSQTKDKKRKTMEEKGKWIPLKEKTGYMLYCKPAHFKHGFKFTNLTSEKEKELLTKYGVYNNRTNKNGCVRDHLLSRRYGYENNIPTWIISHPANCEIVQHTENISRATRKEGDDLITLSELLERINKCILT